MKYDRSYNNKPGLVLTDPYHSLPPDARERYMQVARASQKLYALPSVEDLDEQSRIQLKELREFCKRFHPQKDLIKDEEQ